MSGVSSLNLSSFHKTTFSFLRNVTTNVATNPDFSVMKILVGINLIIMGSSGLAKSHILDRPITWITGREFKEAEANYKLGLSSAAALSVGLSFMSWGVLGVYQRLMAPRDVCYESEREQATSDTNTQNHGMSSLDEQPTSTHPSNNEPQRVFYGPPPPPERTSQLPPTVVPSFFNR